LKRKVTLAEGSETEKAVRQFMAEAIRLSQKWRERGMLGLDIMDDSAFVKLSEELYLTLTIDSFTVNPLFFEGGSIGKLTADGTINDLVVSGGKPIALFDAIVAEEGIEFDVVERAVSDMIERRSWQTLRF